ncbi:MAG: hypothetical protein K6G29_07330 [Clostridiales bacterium]|nr:hypothetical protein [Clostridiales bacterium]
MGKKEKPKKERYDDLIDRKKHPFRWFAQVVWHRNWVFIIGGLILASILSVVVFQSVTAERFDMRFIMAYYDTEIYTPYAVTIEGEIQTIYPDVDGNGKTVVGVDLLNLGDSASVEVNEAYWKKMLASFSDETYVMYILDKRLMNLYSGNENGETPFDPTCIEMYTGRKELFLSLESSPYFKDSDYHGDAALYIAFRPKPSSVKASDEVFYKDYVDILRLLLPDLEAKGQG